jgi:CheY-like chemotaxis protein
VFEVVLPHATDATDAGTASPPGTHADPAAVSRDAAAPPHARPLDAPAAGRSDAPAEDTVPGRPALRPLARLEPQHAPPPRKGARRVLYIEDNDVNALIVREALATVAGFELTVATDGASGVVQAQLAEPELVLLDMQLPDMDGFEVLRRLREHPRTAALPVVALSANALPEQVSRGLAAGLLDYWTKPLDVTLFVQRMVALLPPPAQR